MPSSSTLSLFVGATPSTFLPCAYTRLRGLPHADAGGGAGGSSWLGGTLQSFAVRAGLNISVKLNNVVIKYVETGAYAASLTLSSLHLCTSTDGWQESLQVRLGGSLR